jgi:HK97 family phage prohead protease
MPNIADFDDEESWMAECVPALMDEGRPRDQAVAACLEMWEQRSARQTPSSYEGEGQMERRVLHLEELEVRQEGDEPPHIVGYAAVFGQPSEDLGFIESIREGAFARSIREDDVRSLWNHDANYVLGRNRSGTLALLEDEYGLKIDVVPPDAQWARDLLESIRRRDVTGMSFGFRVRENGDVWTQVGSGPLRRELVDPGPVTFPAYPQTTAGVRARALAAGQGPSREAGAANQRQGRLKTQRRWLEDQE